MTELAGKRVVVAGGGTGIGRAIALRLAERGARVVVAGRRPEPLAEVVDTAAGAGGSMRATALDVVEAGSVDRAIDEAAASLGGLDGIVNAAGIHAVGASEHLDDDDVTRVIDVNLLGAFRLSRAAARHMLPRAAGTIVHVASLSSFGAFPGRLAYGVSKAGLLQLVRTLAVEWGPRGVRVNALVPGFVRTPISERLIAQGQLDVDELHRRTPLRRRADPADMAGPAAFLLSDAAGFVTGQALVVDGGWLAWVGPAGALDELEVARAGA